MMETLGSGSSKDGVSMGLPAAEGAWAGCGEGAHCTGFCAVHALSGDTKSGQVRQGYS